MSALGGMGRRHAIALAKLGFDVVSVEPDIRCLNEFKSNLKQANIDAKVVHIVAGPSGHFDVAIFSETTTSRLLNFREFNLHATAERILLEKPISADPREYHQFLKISSQVGADDRTYVNFVRRAWKHINLLAEMCSKESEFHITLNGGAVGLGCNGIHFLDTFLYLCGQKSADIEYVSLSDLSIASGRGKEFEDIGGDFVVKSGRGRMYASLSSRSSAGVYMTIKGQHFIAFVDYSNWTWKVSRRTNSSKLPFYRYGAEYEVVRDESLQIPSMEDVTASWVNRSIKLPTLAESLHVHHFLDRLLQAGGLRPPYKFT